MVQAFNVTAHFASGGLLTSLQGGNFLSGGLSNGFAAIAGFKASAWTRNASEFVKKAAHYISGALSGGVGSLLGRGSFGSGAARGAIVTGLNHLAHSIEGMINAKQAARQQAIARLRATYERIMAQGNGGLGDPPSWFSRLKQWIAKHGVFKIRGEATYGSQIVAEIKRFWGINLGPRVTFAELSLVDIDSNHSNFFEGNLGTNNRLELGASANLIGANITLHQYLPTIYEGGFGPILFSYSNGHIFIGLDLSIGFAIGLGYKVEVKAGFNF